MCVCDFVFLQITYSALSPTLSNKDVFPWFFRVVAPENVLSFVSVELFVHFNWTNVSVIQQNYQVFTTVSLPLTQHSQHTIL